MLKLSVQIPELNTGLLVENKENNVIYITQRNGSKIYINPELIQTVESTPDTVVTLVSNKKLIVKDTPQEIAERFIAYRRKTLAPFLSRTDGK